MAPRAAKYERSKHIGFLTEFNRAVLLSYPETKSKLDFEIVRHLSAALALWFNPAARWSRGVAVSRHTPNFPCPAGS
jgi:hypothetical protein